MSHVTNRTALVAGCFPGLDARGREFAVAVAKATYVLGGVQLADEQLAIEASDVRVPGDDPTIVAWSADATACKPGTDVVVLGHARPPDGGGTAVAELRVGPVARRAALFGRRTWQRSLTGAVRPSVPEPLGEVPLGCGAAFGGRDETDPDPQRWEVSDDNPGGRGLVCNPHRGDLEAVELPRIEDPRAPIHGVTDRPSPLALGFVSPSCPMRRRWAGTYDAAWRESRFPLLPRDFDPRFYHAVAPEQIAGRPLRGGEAAELVGFTARPLRFSLPAIAVEAVFQFSFRTREILAMTLDTVAIELDLERLVLVFKAQVDLHNRAAELDGVIVQAAGGRV